MKTITNTVYGAYLQTCQVLNKPVMIPANSTLNEKFDIHKDEMPYQDEYPTVKYITIGNGGHRLVTGADGIPVTEPVLHTPRHSALYNHIPFVVRPFSEDLTADERVKYRLRKIITIDGADYVVYYAKVIDLTTTDPKMEYKTDVNGTIYTQDFTPTPQDLNPTPPNIDPNTTVTTSADYVAATAKFPFILDEADILEIQNACNIMYGNDNLAIISEIGICTGIDRAVLGTFNTGEASYTESIATQIAVFVNTFYATKYVNNSIDVSFDVGNVEPLLVLN